MQISLDNMVMHKAIHQFSARLFLACKGLLRTPFSALTEEHAPILVVAYEAIRLVSFTPDAICIRRHTQRLQSTFKLIDVH